MRIAVCLSHFHPTVGGAERQLLELARRWVDRGHGVLVLTRRLPGLPRGECLEGLEIRRCIRPVALGPLFGVSFVVTLCLTLVRLRGRYDVVLAGQGPWEAVATGLVARLLGKRSVVRVANSGRYGDLALCVRARGGRLLAALVRRNDRFLALSEQARRELIRFGCPATAVRRVTNGVDVARFRPGPARDAERDRTVLFVGRLAEQKNVELLLRAWQRLNRPGRYRLLIAGDGPLRQRLQGTASDLQLKDVSFLGPCDDMPSVYGRAAVFALPSLSEGCCNSLLEAMASGLCPVVSDIGPNRQVVQHERTGLVVELNERRWAEVLAAVLADPARRDRFAAAARQYVAEHHRLDRVADDYLAVLAELV